MLQNNNFLMLRSRSDVYHASHLQYVCTCFYKYIHHHPNRPQRCQMSNYHWNLKIVVLISKEQCFYLKYIHYNYNAIIWAILTRFNEAFIQIYHTSENLYFLHINIFIEIKGQSIRSYYTAEVHCCRWWNTSIVTNYTLIVFYHYIRW